MNQSVASCIETPDTVRVSTEEANDLLSLSEGAALFEEHALVMINDVSYQVACLIGQGVSACVYSVVDRNGRTYALKVLRPEYASPLRIERFKRESALLRELSHPHLVKGYAGGVLLTETSGPLHYILMEYIPGLTLDKIPLADLDILSACSIISDIACVLNYLYFDGRVHAHRDLKPANIMWCKNGCALLLDLGIAKTPLRFNLSIETQTVGTLRYMAPEQFNNSHHVDIRCDLYALGVIFYELLEARNPEVASSKTFMKQRFSQAYLTLDKECCSRWMLDETVYHKVDELIRTLTTTEVAARYQTPDAVLADLAFISDLIKTHPYPPSSSSNPCENQCRDHPSSIPTKSLPDRHKDIPHTTAKQRHGKHIPRLRPIVQSLFGISILIVTNVAYMLYAPLVIETVSLHLLPESAQLPLDQMQE